MARYDSRTWSLTGACISMMRVSQIKSIIVVALVSTAPLAPTAFAQIARPAGEARSGQDICRELAGFVEGRGGTIRAAQTTITLEEVRGYMRNDN